MCHRLITYALLTRPPLSYTYSIRRLPIYTFVRLACVRHAASVHPEPGSNSQLKFILQLFADICVVFPYLPCFRFVLFTIRFSLSIYIHCQFAKTFVSPAWYSSFIILFLFFFVKHFLTKYFIFLLSFLCFFKSIEIFCFYLVSLTARI